MKQTKEQNKNPSENNNGQHHKETKKTSHVQPSKTVWHKQSILHIHHHNKSAMQELPHPKLKR